MFRTSRDILYRFRCVQRRSTDALRCRCFRHEEQRYPRSLYDTCRTLRHDRSLQTTSEQSRRAISLYRYFGMAKTFDDELSQDFLRMKASDPLVPYTHEYTVFHYLGDVTGKSVLDLGCGYGHYCRLIKKRGASRVIGVDISPSMLDLAKKEEEKDPLGIEYRLGDGTKVEKYGEFDIVLANAVFIFMETPEELQKMVRVVYDNLKPQGRLFTLQANGFSENWYESSAKYGRKCVRVENLPHGTVAKIICNCGPKLMEVIHHYLDLPTYEKVFKDVGFKSFQSKAPVLSDEAYQKHPEGFWKEFVESPYLVVLEAVK